MAKIQLVYRTAVYVTVDTEHGIIESASVNDDIGVHDLVREDAMNVTGGWSEWTLEFPDDLYDKAVSIAEDGDTEWPSWNFGS